MKFLKHLFHPVSKSVLVSKAFRQGDTSLACQDKTSYLFRCETCGCTWKEVILGKEISSIKIGE